VSRVREGTTMAGFACDAAACSAKATHSPVLCVPYEGYPPETRRPMIAFVDKHVCPDHFRYIRTDDMLDKRIRDQMEAIAAQNHGRPDFKRAFLNWCRCISDDYQRFQESAGLVKPDDAKADGSIIMPNFKL
jgi:hypothetical protein